MAAVANLLWLKAHLSAGYYRRSIWRIVGLAITGAIALFISFFSYFFLLVLFRALEPDTARSILYLLFFGLYLSWVLLPVLGLRLNESFDLSKLLVYPITTRQMFLGTILGNFMDVTVLALLPTLLSVPMGFGRTPGTALLISLIVLAFLLHALSLAQTLMFLLWRVMRSRRLKDLAVLLGSAVAMLGWIGQQMLFRHTASMNPFLILGVSHSPVLRWLPSGLAAEGVVSAADGRTLHALGLLVVLLALNAGAVYASGALIARIHSGESDMGPARVNSRKPATRARARPAERRAGLGLTPEVEAVARKEWLYFARDPRLKAMLIQTLALMVFLPILTVMRGNFSPASIRESPVIFIATGGFYLLSCLTLSSNQFAPDGAGLNLLFLFSCSRRRLIQGKNLTLFAILSVAGTALTLLLLAITRQVEDGLLAWIGMESSLLVMLAMGNLLSIYFPFKMRARGENPMTASAGQGCLTLLLRPILHLLVLVVASPVVAAVVLPQALGTPGWYALSLPAAVAYGAGGYLLLLGWAERALLSREPEIIKACVREPE